MPRGRKKDDADSEPHLAVREHRDGTFSLNIRNGGAAAKIFLLEADGTLERVVTAEEYPAVWNDGKVARSKRGFAKGMSGFLARGATVKAAQKDEVVKAVTENFKGVRKLVEAGGLRKAQKPKVEIIPLE